MRLSSVIVAAVLAATPGALGESAVVTLTSGQRLAGEVVEQDNRQVVISIAGIERPIDRLDIASLTVAENPAAVYRQLKAMLPPESPDRWYDLLLYLDAQGQADLAWQEVQALIAAFPDHAPARRLLTALDARARAEAEQQRLAQLRLRDDAAAPDTEATTEADDADAAAGLLTAEQINLIRLWELPADLGDARPRIQIPRDVITELFDRYAGRGDVPTDPRAQAQFRRRSTRRQLQTIFDLRARELYPRVAVLQDPEPLDVFRKQINPNYVARYFARYFHGDALPGLNVELLSHRPNGLHHAYTNFYRLSTAMYEGLPLIDRIEPERSLLLQWGLPREVAIHPAPDVPQWRPHFTGTSDPTYRRYLRWIASLYDPTPDYGLEPETSPAPQP